MALLGFDGDGSTHRFHAFANDRKTEAHALRPKLFVEMGVYAHELIEDELELGFWDADPVVTYPHAWIRHRGRVGLDPNDS